MAGILANSAAEQMVAGDTSATNSRSGYIVGEQITLSVSPSASSYSWAQAIPSASAPARSRLSETDQSTAKFTPDVGGTYVVTCLVDGVTSYTLVLTVTNTAVVDLAEVLRLSPVRDSQVASPTLGLALYFSSTQDALTVKDPDGNLFTVDLTAVP